MPDEIIEELWRIKDEIAREHGYDVESLAAYLQSKERTEGRQLVDLQSLRKATGQGESPKSPIRLSKGDKSRKWEAVAPRAIPRWPSPKNGESRA